MLASTNHKGGEPWRPVESTASVAGSPPRSWRRCSQWPPRRRWPTIRCPTRRARSRPRPRAYSVPGYTKPDPAKATTKDLAVAVDAVAQSASHGLYSSNFVWTLVAGFLVMFMQAGFALVETGLIRAKNAAHTMSMNFVVYALGMLGFFVCGFAFMCGGLNGTAIGGPASLGGVPTLHSMLTVGGAVNGDHGWGLFGTTGFFLSGNGYDAGAIVLFLFMMVFMDTTATIVTGACAERWSFKSFCLFSVLIGAFIYPVFGGWVWGGGWLAQLGYRAGLGHGAVDYAGSGVVHLQGGALALITAILIGPRIGKYGKDGKINAIKPHHIPMVMLGTFILAFGWFGFNAGSSLAGGDGRIGIVATNTMLAGMSATVFGMVYMWLTTGKPDPSMMCNSMLAGLVAITSPCAFVVAGRRVHHRRHRRRAGHLERQLLRQGEDRRSGRRDQRPRRQRRLGPHRGRPVLRRQLRRRAGTASARPTTSASRAAASPACSTATRSSWSPSWSRSCVGVGWNVVVGGIAFCVIGKLGSATASRPRSRSPASTCPRWAPWPIRTSSHGGRGRRLPPSPRRRV